MAVNLLSYQGNAGLGAGAGSAPATPTNPDLSVINNTIRDVMLLDNQKNVLLFQNKIKDRDALTEMIMNNQVSSGDILPEYRKHFDEAEKRAESAFNVWGGNFNDKEGYRKYQAAITDLKDISVHAQSKTLGLRQLEKEKAQQTLPRKQAEYAKWIDREKAKPFFDPVTPYQQLHDFAVDDIMKLARPLTRKSADPNNPFNTFDETYFDYNDALRTAQSTYINDQDAADSIDQFVDKLESQLDPMQLSKTVDSLNQQLEKYNQERQLQPGMKGYVDPIKTVPKEGRLLINEPKMTLAAKWALASQQQFTTRTPNFNKDLAKFAIDKEKLNLQAKKLGIEAGKAAAYIRHLGAKTDKFVRDQMTVGTDIRRQYEDFVDTMKPRGLAIGPKGTEGNTDVIYMDMLPANYQFINGPVIATDAKGKPTGKITVGKLEPFISTNTKKPYYLPKYVSSTTGDEINPKSDFVQQTYRTWRQGGYAGSVDDMMKMLLKNGALEMILQGKNGAANYTSMYQSAKAINALGTTKGEENIINPPAPIPEEPEVPEQP